MFSFLFFFFFRGIDLLNVSAKSLLIYSAPGFSSLACYLLEKQGHLFYAQFHQSASAGTFYFRTLSSGRKDTLGPYIRHSSPRLHLCGGHLTCSSDPEASFDVDWIGAQG